MLVSITCVYGKEGSEVEMGAKATGIGTGLNNVVSHFRYPAPKVAAKPAFRALVRTGVYPSTVIC